MGRVILKQLAQVLPDFYCLGVYEVDDSGAAGGRSSSSFSHSSASSKIPAQAMTLAECLTRVSMACVSLAASTTSQGGARMPVVPDGRPDARDAPA
jgi:hypothetical protein